LVILMIFRFLKKGLKKTKALSETINRRMTDNTMVKRERTK
jgi:hypothetical protein